MRKTTRLKDLILARKILVMPGAFDVISAKIVEEAGFAAIQVSGANLVACHYGVPDYSLVSMREMVEQTGRIASAVDVPVMGDADTGFGNAVNAYLTVQAFESAGVAGINLEDQMMPKRCGHLDGKTLLPLDEACAKVAAAAAARHDPDFVINARTDALSVAGIDEVVRRGVAYLEAGATMVFVEGVTSVEEIRDVVRRIAGPVGINLVEGGKSPQNLRFTELEAIGVARVSLPSTLMQATIKAQRAVLARVCSGDGIGSYGELLAGFGIAQRFVGRDRIVDLERQFLTTLAKTSGAIEQEDP